MNQQESDFEARAREDGWMPEAEWKGDPAKWIPAEEFVKRGENFLPIVNAKLRKERERTAKLEADVNELREGNKQFLQFHEQTLAKERKEREQAIAELEAERKKAVTNGDGEAFDAADKEIKRLEAARATAPSSSPPTPSPHVLKWKEENPWYDTDVGMTKLADRLSNALALEQPNLKGKPFLDKLSEMVKEVLPHKFQNPRREQSTTESHERRPQSKTGRAYEDLPEEAKAACDKFVKTMPGFTKEAYLKHYDWSQK
jgi:hypothetical protein